MIFIYSYPKALDVPLRAENTRKLTPRAVILRLAFTAQSNVNGRGTLYWGLPRLDTMGDNMVAVSHEGGMMIGTRDGMI